MLTMTARYCNGQWSFGSSWAE